METSLDASYVSDELDEVSVDVHVLENMPHGFGIGRKTLNELFLLMSGCQIFLKISFLK